MQTLRNALVRGIRVRRQRELLVQRARGAAACIRSLLHSTFQRELLTTASSPNSRTRILLIIYLWILGNLL